MFVLMTFKRPLTVFHSALLYKLAKLHINGHFHAIMHHMYQNNKLRVQDKLSHTFDPNIGVRQDDNLSPIFFKIFNNDLP